jgi:nucleoside-diphosphate-sugar epimerase
MANSSACIIGANGLVGSLLLEALALEKKYDNIITLSRKPILRVSDKHFPYVIDFDNLKEYSFLFDTDDLFICIGTTLKKAGSKKQFIKIDKGFAIQSAEHFSSLGGKRVFLISAAGANPKSSIFYNRIKGEVEKAILDMKFSSCYIFRPGLLLGERKEKRFLEKSAKKAYSFINMFIEPVFKSYIGTRVKDLVDSILFYSSKHKPETKIIANREIKNYSYEK